MARRSEETIVQWHARAVQECRDASDAFGLLGQRRVTISDALAGNVFGRVDAAFDAVFARLEAARLDLLAAVGELQHSSGDGFWPRNGRHGA
jgi:hypothetical protein